MLWVALCFPRLALEARLRGCASPEQAGEPWAVVENRRVLACSAAAEAAGVRPGSALAMAWALAPSLRAMPRAPEAEREALQAIATWACQFSEKVSLEPPQAVLLEVEGSLRLFGGAARLSARLHGGVAELGFKARLATGPTPRAALWLARGEAQTLSALPVEAMDLPPETLDLLRRVGVQTLGEVMALPRPGLALRFGQTLLDRVDQALDKAPEPRVFFHPPERFSAKLDLPAPANEAERVLFAARRLLAQMEGFLAARQAGVRTCTLSLLHRDGQATHLALGFGSLRRDAEHALLLLRERLNAVSLASPADAIHLEAAALEPLIGASRGLFGDARVEAEAWERLTERLQARLGPDRAAAGAAPAVAARAAAPARGRRLLAAGGPRAHRVGMVGRGRRGARLLHRRARTLPRLDLSRPRGLVPAWPVCLTTPSCIACRTSPSCAVPRTPRSWWRVPRRSATRRSG